MTPPAPPSRLSHAAAPLGLGLALLALLGAADALTGNGRDRAFDPTLGLLLAVLVRSPRGQWPRFLLAAVVAFLVHRFAFLSAGASPAPATLALDLAAASASALALQRLAPDALSLGRVRDVGRFLGVATAATLTIGLLAAALAARVEPSLGLTLRSVWSASLLGVLAVAPLVLTLSDPRLRDTLPALRERLELSLLLLALAAAAFATYHASAPLQLPRGLPALLLMWIAFRFGPRGGALALPVMTIVVLWASSQGALATIPSLGARPVPEGWEIQGFLALSFVTILMLGALGEERAVLVERLEREVRVLRGLLPICAHCKQIRDEATGWQPLESYIERHSEASFTHSICPSCLSTHYGSLLEGDR